MNFRKCILFFLLFFVTLIPAYVFAQDKVADAQIQIVSEEINAKVIEVISKSTEGGISQIVFTAESEGELFTVDTSESFLEGLRYSIAVGDTVFLQILRDTQTNEVTSVYLMDVKRTTSLLLIALFFAFLILAIGWSRGFASLIGLVVTIAILFLFIFPNILSGADPVLVTVIGSIFILFVNMHLSHGINKSTFFAFLSTIVGLILVYLFAKVFVGFTDLSGLASEESILLYFKGQEVIFPKGILLAGIILGAVGVLDDIAVTQSETVAELKKANPRLNRKDLFSSAMRIGRHHIASTVNTLVLAYVGVAMPLFLLFLMTPEIDYIRFLNEELVAEEIVRTLAGTMALILTVPISTWFATFIQKR